MTNKNATPKCNVFFMWSCHGNWLIIAFYQILLTNKQTYSDENILSRLEALSYIFLGLEKKLNEHLLDCVLGTVKK